MRTLRFSDGDFSLQLAALDRRATPAAEVEATVKEILRQVREEGDRALLALTEKFGGPRFASAEELRVTPQEFEAAKAAVPAQVREAIAASHENVRQFGLHSRRTDWSNRNAQGVEVGERFDPFERVGVYVPGGTAPLVSTAIMTCTLAAVAGVPEIVVTTPSDAEGNVNPALLYALEYAGATEVYKVGGAQAIGALACGTATIPPVVKIYGPGNAYVVEAKRQTVGLVAIDLLPGPSEILVLADETANPAWIAADLLAQAEHGKNSAVVLVTDSEAILEGVRREIDRQAATLSRASHLREVLEGSTTLVLVADLDAAIDLCNRFAPEHASVVTRDDDAVAARLRTCGAIFLGALSPVAGGDFFAGPSHVLPTGGAGKSFPGLTVDQFQRRTSLVRFDRASLARSLPGIEAFAGVEGLDAHGRSASIRLETPGE
ncbi:MAG TPA: histidinol dehydrogenase [Chthoniobacteraceae bacterium]|nr:histidinol dehydrogenase [Chthoniobacteraceae bacterium]